MLHTAMSALIGGLEDEMGNGVIIRKSRESQMGEVGKAELGGKRLGQAGKEVEGQAQKG